VDRHWVHHRASPRSLRRYLVGPRARVDRRHHPARGQDSERRHDPDRRVGRPNRDVAASTDPDASQPVGHAERLLGDGPAIPARNTIFRKAMTPGCWSRAVRSRNRPTMSQRSIKGSHGPDGSDGMHGMTSGCCSAGRRKVGIGRSSPRTNPFRSRLIFIWSCGDLYKRLAASCVVFRMRTKRSWLLFALAGEVQQQLKDVDEVQIEREGAEHGELLL
jgi:hypothetical protein